MRIIDQHLYGGLDGSLCTGNSFQFVGSWAMFLMPGQEPKTFSAAAQVFDITDIAYLYNECRGIAFDVNSREDKGTDVFNLVPSTRTLFKGYNYYDGKVSAVLPDTISGSKVSLAGLLSYSRPTGGVYDVKLSLTFNTHINLVGFHMSDPAGTVPTVYADGTQLTLTKEGNRLVLAEPVTVNVLEYRRYNCGLIPLAEDLPIGAVPDVTYFVLAPVDNTVVGQKGAFWTETTEFPYIIGTATYDLSVVEAQAYLSGKMRTAETTMFLRSILLQELEA